MQTNRWSNCLLKQDYKKKKNRESSAAEIQEQPARSTRGNRRDNATKRRLKPVDSVSPSSAVYEFSENAPPCLFSVYPWKCSNPPLFSFCLCRTQAATAGGKAPTRRGRWTSHARPSLLSQRGGGRTSTPHICQKENTHSLKVQSPRRGKGKH